MEGGKMRKKVLILVNRSSGRKKGASGLMSIIEKAAKSGFEPVVYPILPGTKLDSESLLDRYEGKVEQVLCIGGDGTLNHVVNKVMTMDKKPMLAYMPSGSTNDFSKSLGMTDNFQKKLGIAFGDRTISYDIGNINGRYFNYTAAFGAFSKVSYSTDQKLKNVLGYPAYVLTAVMTLQQNLGFKRHIEMVVDGVKEEGDYVFGAVCNSISIGGMSILEKAHVQIDDGKMELLLIKAPRNPIELEQTIATLIRGETGNPNVTLRQIRHAVFRAEEGLAWSIDGEYGGNYHKSDISVVEKAITIKCGPVRK